jgi:hypothetical protein
VCAKRELFTDNLAQGARCTVVNALGAAAEVWQAIREASRKPRRVEGVRFATPTTSSL